MIRQCLKCDFPLKQHKNQRQVKGLLTVIINGSKLLLFLAAVIELL